MEAACYIALNESPASSVVASAARLNVPLELYSQLKFSLSLANSAGILAAKLSLTKMLLQDDAAGFMSSPSPARGHVDKIHTTSTSRPMVGRLSVDRAHNHTTDHLHFTSALFDISLG